MNTLKGSTASASTGSYAALWCKGNTAAEWKKEVQKSSGVSMLKQSILLSAALRKGKEAFILKHEPSGESGDWAH